MDPDDYWNDIEDAVTELKGVQDLDLYDENDVARTTVVLEVVADNLADLIHLLHKHLTLADPYDG